ncbi:hypothetical protein KC887_01325 [Candidatus Kaiserbacteria bacterium]|nr:hypothetical protein [Candidatus Kaiserbacteria bacterium]
MSFMVDPSHADDMAKLYELLEADDTDFVEVTPSTLWYWLDRYLDRENDKSKLEELKENLHKVLAVLDRYLQQAPE